MVDHANNGAGSPLLRRLAIGTVVLGWIAGSYLIAGLIPSLPLAVLAFGFLSAPSWSYLLTPVQHRSGMVTYLSGFLRYSPLYEGTRLVGLVLHLGTSHDLLWRVLPLMKPGERTAAAVRREIYRGLCRLCERIEAGQIPVDATVLVCSYFLSPARMKRLGFERDETSREGRLLESLTPRWLLFCYLDLMLTRSMILGRARWAQPWRSRCYRIPARRLASHSHHFRRLAGESAQDGPAGEESGPSSFGRLRAPEPGDQRR